MSKISLQYYENISQYFFRQGKKGIMEKLFSRLLLNRAQAKKKAIAPLLENCFYSAIPYIRLKTKTRRRGKRVLYRVTFIERKQAEKASLSAFTKQVSAQKNDRFINKLENEIESFAGNKNYPARILRDKIHKIGLKAIPKKYKTMLKSNLGLKNNPKFKTNYKGKINLS